MYLWSIFVLWNRNHRLLVSNAKCRQVEIKDILTWTEAFTIFQLVPCASNPLHWLDLFQFQFQFQPSVTVLPRYLRFLSLHHYSWINFKWSCTIIPTGPLKSASSNVCSSSEHPSGIDSSSLPAGWQVPPLPSLHISHSGVIPKIISLGSGVSFWTLSSPVGQSVNDGIPKPPFTIQYVSGDAFIDGIMTLGRGTLMVERGQCISQCGNPAG